VTREEQRRLKELKKALGDAEKSLAKSGGFQRSHGYTFCFADGFVYWLYPKVNLSSVGASLSVKPTALDRVLWDVFDLPDNRDQPRSFHVWGAFVAQFHSLPDPFEVPLPGPEADCVESAYAEVLAYARSAVVQFSGKLKEVEDFQKLINDDPNEKLNRILCEIHLGRRLNALSLLRDALARGETGGFIGPRGSIYEYAIAFLERT